MHIAHTCQVSLECLTEYIGLEEMTAAFATEATTEAYYAEQVAKIREHYQAAEVAAAGIFIGEFFRYFRGTECPARK